MIKAILVFNNHGKPRLSKFYQYFVSRCILFRVEKPEVRELGICIIDFRNNYKFRG